jgi:hypothetical protein
MIEFELTDQEAAVLLDEVEMCIGIAAEADADEHLRTLTSIQMKLESAMDA